MNPNDECSCGHSAASHGFNYEGACTLPNCGCGLFSLAVRGDDLPREDGPDPVRPALPKVDKLILPPDDQPDGYWLVRHRDGTPIGVFLDEIGALRYAVANAFSVHRQAWGEIGDVDE